MSVDLKTQVRDYTEFFMGTVESIDLEEIKERPLRLGEGPVQPLASPSRHRGWLVAVAGAVVVLVLGLLTFLTQQTTPEAPVLSQPSPSPTVTTPAPAPSTPIEESASGWSQVSHDEAIFGGAVMWGVTEGGPGLVAVGSDSFYLYAQEQIYLDVYDDGDTYGDRYGFGDAVVWTSVDGAIWSRVPHDEAVFGGDGEQQMFSVISGGPGLVAVGFDGRLDNEEPDAAVWTSADGITWSRVPHDEAVFGGPGEQRMLSVTVGGPGLVAVGFDTTLDADRADAAVWTSPDGITWSRVPHDEAVFGGDGEQQMLSVTSGGPGLVAVGSDGYPGDEVVERPDEASDAAVWTSTDGFTWSRVPNDAAVFGGPTGHERMLSVTSGGPGLVAVGSVSENATENFFAGSSDAAVWTSSDGVVWSRVPHDAAVFGGTGWGMMRQVIVGGPGLVAVGSSGFDQSGWDAAVWISPDGIAWTRVPHDKPVFGGDPGYNRMFGVTVGDSGLVAVGRKWGGGDFDAGVWED